MVTRCCRPLAAWHRHRSWRMCISRRSRCTRWRRVCPLKLHTQGSAFRVIVEPEVHVSGSVRGHPLTIPDNHSRYALGLAACPNQRTATVRAHLISAFQRYGLPDRLLVDNGSPWGNHPAHPYTPLTVWLRRLGIAVSHSRPYHPQTLGKDERFHGTLQRDLARQPLSGQPQALPSATAAAARRARRSTATSSDGRLGVLPGPPTPAPKGSARPTGRVSPDAYGRLLGDPVPDRRLGHTRPAGASLAVSTMSPVWTPLGEGVLQRFPYRGYF